MHDPAVNLLIASLFFAVVALLAYGAYAYGWRGSQVQGSSVNMGFEVLWTGLAALLLLGIFIYVR